MVRELSARWARQIEKQMTLPSGCDPAHQEVAAAGLRMIAAWVMHLDTLLHLIWLNSRPYVLPDGSQQMMHGGAYGSGKHSYTHTFRYAN